MGGRKREEVGKGEVGSSLVPKLFSAHGGKKMAWSTAYSKRHDGGAPIRLLCASDVTYCNER